jgi:HK97 family phage portal protein
MNIKNLFKKVEKKALSHTDVYGCDFIDIGGGFRYIGTGDLNAQETVSYNNNFVFACIKKIEQYISSVPVHLYFWSEDDPNKLLTPHKIVNKHLVKIVNEQPRITKKTATMIEITDHELLNFLRHPAENMSYSDWIGIIASYMLATGNVLLQIIKDGQTIKYLKPLKWEHITTTITTGRITDYFYNDPCDTMVHLKPNEVVHIRNYAPGHLLVGKSNISACIDSAMLFKWYDQYQTTLASNYGMPGVSINVKNKIGNEEEAQKIADKFIRKFSGANNGKPIVSFGDIDIKTLSTSPKDMEYVEGRRSAMKVICAAMGVPEDLISTDDSNRASSTTAMNHFRQITIFPLLSKILEQVNTQVVNPYFDENAFIWFDPMEALEQDPKGQADILSAYVEKGIMSINEVRKLLGLPVINEGVTE